MGKHSDFRISSFCKVVSMHDEFCSTLTEKLKNILKTLHGFGGRCHNITEWHLCGSLTVLQES